MNERKAEFIEYAKKNKKEYYNILKLYDCQKYKEYYIKFNEFYKDIKDEIIKEKEILELKDLFYKINKSVCLNKHQEVCVLTMGVYLSLFLKLSKENKKSENENKSESTKETENIKEKHELTSDTSNDNTNLNFNENFNKINEKIKITSKQINILINIFKQLQKECVEKINSFSMARGDSCVNEIEIDYNNKITFIAYKQMESLVMKNNCIFSGDKNTHQIKVYSDTGKSTTLCVIDNLKIKFNEEKNKKYINVTVGEKTYKIFLLKDKITFFEGIDILENNIKALKNILISLESNKKMINYWLNISKYDDDDILNK